MVRIWGMMGWWVSVEAQWGQNMRQKEGWFFWLEMSTGWHAKRWRTKSFVEWTSGGMVVIFQGGGNKKLADVGPWLRDKIVERFKQANVGPEWTRSWVATMSEWCDHISLGDFLIVGTYGTCCPKNQTVKLC